VTQRIATAFIYRYRLLFYLLRIGAWWFLTLHCCWFNAILLLRLPGYYIVRAIATVWSLPTWLPVYGYSDYALFDCYSRFAFCSSADWLYVVHAVVIVTLPLQRLPCPDCGRCCCCCCTPLHWPAAPLPFPLRVARYIRCVVNYDGDLYRVVTLFTRLLRCVTRSPHLRVWRCRDARVYAACPFTFGCWLPFAVTCWLRLPLPGLPVVTVGTFCIRWIAL